MYQFYIYLEVIFSVYIHIICILFNIFINNVSVLHMYFQILSYFIWWCSSVYMSYNVSTYLYFISICLCIQHLYTFTLFCKQIFGIQNIDDYCLLLAKNYIDSSCSIFTFWGDAVRARLWYSRQGIQKISIWVAKEEKDPCASYPHLLRERNFFFFFPAKN